MSEPGRGRDDDDDLHADAPAFSDEGMRRIIYGRDHGQPRETGVTRSRDSRSRAFDDDTAELEAGLRGRRSLVPAVTALAAVFCFGAIVWYAYSWGTGQMTSEELPVVRAQPMPDKVRPEQPGGMEVPHQGIAVLNEGGEGAGATPGQGSQTAERLLPRPETPAPPEPLPQPETTAQLPAQETLPEAPEAPLIADGSAADITEAPELAPEFAEDIPAAPDGETTQMAEGGVMKPIPKPAENDQIARLLEQQPLETANGATEIPAPPAPAATQTAAVTAGDVVLQLSSVKSEAAAAKEWQRLKAAHPGLLGDRPLTLETAQVSGTTYYRVQTGPFPNRSAAADVCSQLKARNQDCLVKQR
jgi:hypothetical protein